MDKSGIKSTILVHARYHAFRLAEGLSELNVLDKIYTLNPRFKLKDYNIKHSEIKSFWPIGALKYLNQKLKLGLSDPKITSLLDRLVALFLKRPAKDWIFTGYSGYSEYSLRKAKKLGAVVCVERSCPHIDFQEELVREEKTLLLGKESPLPENPVRERMKREYELADFIIVPSSYSKKSFLERGFEEDKIVITPLCGEKDVSLEKYPRIYPEVFTVLGVCGHFYRKGLFYLLKAWQELGLKNAKLIIRGDVPEEFKELKNLPGLELITHHMSDNEMIKLYCKSSVFVLPSVDDGFGMVVVEAMSAALPVIITENVGAADIIEDGKEGFIAPIRNISVIKEKIKFFYENPSKIKELGDYAYQTAKSYTKEKYAHRMLECYKIMLSSKQKI